MHACSQRTLKECLTPNGRINVFYKYTHNMTTLTHCFHPGFCLLGFAFKLKINTQKSKNVMHDIIHKIITCTHNVPIHVHVDKGLREVRVWRVGWREEGCEEWEIDKLTVCFVLGFTAGSARAFCSFSCALTTCSAPCWYCFLVLCTCPSRFLSMFKESLAASISPLI